jgi:hypothetical protein
MCSRLRTSVWSLSIPLVLLALVLPAPAQAGKNTCSNRPIFLQEVSVRERTGINTDEIHADYLPALEHALEKKGFLLVTDGGAGAADGVALRVKVRAWTSRTATDRTLLELASSVRVMDGETELWDGDVDAGAISRLLHAKHSDPANLAKRTAELVSDACRSGWTLKQ